MELNKKYKKIIQKRLPAEYVKIMKKFDAPVGKGYKKE